MANTYLTRTPSSTGNDKIATFSAWIKRASTLGSQNNLFTSFPASERTQLFLTNNDTLQLQAYSGNSATMNVETSRKFRDTNAWYHIVVAMDSTQATASNRVKIYINGVQETAFDQSSYIGQNTTLSFNTSSRPFYVGTYDTSQLFFDGCMSHVHWVDGTAYTASTFGSTDSTTGEWKINAVPSVTYGTNGFFILKDGNSVTDQSGNSNNLTVGGGTLTKTEDNPSNNFATWSAILAMNSTMVLTNGATTGKTATNYAAGASNTWWSSLGMSSGKYYCEIKMSAATANQGEVLGVGYDLSKHQQGSTVNAYHLGYISEGWAYFGAEGKVKSNNSDVVTGLPTWTTNDIIGIAIDMDNNKLYFSKNGTFVNSGDPTSGSTGTGAISLTANKTYFFGCSDASMSNTNTFQANFGNGYFGTTAVSSAGTNASGIGIFEYDVPTGYTALSTKGFNT